MMTDQLDPLVFEDHVFDFAFHPSQDIVCVGLINGLVQCYNYTSSNRLQWSTKAFKKSCRGLDFTPEGSHIICVSRDKSIQAIDVATGRLLYKIPKAHKFAINKLCKLDTHLIGTGDDDGVVKIWDMRTCKAVQEYKVHHDYIADMNYNQPKSSLVVAGGDGLISIYDTRKPVGKMDFSVELEDELLSMALLEDGNKIVVGSQSGALYSWEWGQWDKSRKWLGHPSSVDAICKLDEETVCTGGNDGLLRLVSIQPYKFEGILGDHGEDFPVECIKTNSKYLASCGHDLSLRFWGLQSLSDEDEEEEQKGISSKRKEMSDTDSLATNSKKIRAGFFENL